MKRIRKYGCLFLSVLVLLGVLPVSVTAAEPKGETVRVGWFEDSYNITDGDDMKSGYGYEYQQTVASYTGWTYEYVNAGWSDLLKMMQNGELDLMSGVSYTEERAETMLFSELPMGEEKYYLYADLANTDISASDLSTLNGKRIGLLEGSIHATQFYEWEQEHNLHLEHVPITGFEDAKEKTINHEIDCMISTETPQAMEIGMSAIVTIGGSDIYFVINRERPDLKEELDRAMRKIQSDKPFYADELYQRYLSAVSSAILDSEEQAWLSQHGPIRIGWLNHDTGVSDFDTGSGEMVGVLNDYITYAADCLDNQTLEFDLVGFDSQEELIKALQEDQIDMIFHFSSIPYAAEQNGFILSNTVWSDNMAAVTGQEYLDENARNSVAVEKDNDLLKWYIYYNYPEWDVVEYDTFAEAEEAVREGKEDCLIAGFGQLTKYLEDNRLHCVYLTQPDNAAFAVRRENTTLVTILNKTLKTMPSSMLTGALSMYENTLRKATLKDFLKENLLGIILVLFTVFLVVLGIILRFLQKSRVAEAKAKQAASEAEKLNKKLQESHQELEVALLRQKAQTLQKPLS